MGGGGGNARHWGKLSILLSNNWKSSFDVYFWKVDEPQTSWLESSFDITAVKTEDIDDNDDSGEQYPEDGEYLESGGIAEEGQYFDEDTGWLKNLDLLHSHLPNFKTFLYPLHSSTTPMIQQKYPCCRIVLLYVHLDLSSIR